MTDSPQPPATPEIDAIPLPYRIAEMREGVSALIERYGDGGFGLGSYLTEALDIASAALSDRDIATRTIGELREALAGVLLLAYPRCQLEQPHGDFECEIPKAYKTIENAKALLAVTPTLPARQEAWDDAAIDRATGALSIHQLADINENGGGTCDCGKQFYDGGNWLHHQSTVVAAAIRARAKTEGPGSPDSQTKQERGEG